MNNQIFPHQQQGVLYLTDNIDIPTDLDPQTDLFYRMRYNKCRYIQW